MNNLVKNLEVLANEAQERVKEQLRSYESITSKINTLKIANFAAILFLSFFWKETGLGFSITILVFFVFNILCVFDATKNNELELGIGFQSFPNELSECPSKILKNIIEAYMGAFSRNGDVVSKLSIDYKTLSFMTTLGYLVLAMSAFFNIIQKFI
jgi:hypothetical protein